MDIRQSLLYKSFLEQIGWQIKKIGRWNIFIRKIPLFGKIAKLQKITPPIPFDEIAKFVRNEKIKQLTIEPDITHDRIVEAQFLANGYKLNHSPFLPTKTILIDLTPSENNIFRSFPKEKRRLIRKALKNNVKIHQSTDIESFIKLKIGYFPFLGFLLKHEYHALWQTFSQQNATLLLASCFDDLNHRNKTLAGILLLFHGHKAYYWLAASTKQGNTYAAPSLLVWEALKLSKKRGCTVFDFEGIYDSRFHKATKNWQGFTSFKKGFGGREITYLGSFIS